MSFLLALKRYKSFLAVVATLLIFLPLIFIYPTKAGKCAYVLLVMAVLWLTEVIPLAVTSLFPVVLLPLLTVQTSKEISINYMKDTNMLFIGGLIVAIAVEHHNLHKRIALSILTRITPEPKWLLMGFMAPTWLLSMWISNTASTAMMIPIVSALLHELKSQNIDAFQKKKGKTSQSDEQSDDNGNRENSSTMSGGTRDDKIIRVEFENSEKPQFIDAEGGAAGAHGGDADYSMLSKATNLCIAYAATCGGMATLTGTAPNLILHGVVLKRYGSAANLNFGSWMIFAFPISLLCLLTCWLWLLLIFWGFRGFRSRLDKSEKKKVTNVFKAEYDKLGPISFAEKSCALFLSLLIVLWITKEPGFDGWIRFFKVNSVKYVSDSTPAIFVAILMMIWPDQSPFDVVKNKERKFRNLLPWSVVQSNFPLGIVLLIGGGFVLAEACEKSGLSAIVGGRLSVLGSLPIYALVLILCVVSALLTEITSSTAVTSIVLSVLAPVADCLNINPLLILFPVTLSCTFAFCLPVATPPNAIVFSQGNLKVIEMAKAGILMNIIAILITIAATFTYGNAYFQFFVVPSWHKSCNVTLT